MERAALLLSLCLVASTPPAYGDSSRALRDIALTSIAVRRTRTAAERKSVLDGAFDSVPRDLRDSLRDSPVRAGRPSARKRNWFASSEWYSPSDGPFRMPALSLPPREPGFFGKIGRSFRSALVPYRRLIDAAAQSGWSSVAVVQTLAG